MQEFTTTLRVRHYEMDALGHVNHAVYLHYLEQAAVEHSEQLGFDVQRYRKLGGMFIMRKLEIDYRSPAVAGDTLVITTSVKEMRGPRAIRRYEIRKQADNTLLVTAEAVWAWVSLKQQRPLLIPREVIDAFKPELAPLPASAPLICSRCGTPLERQGARPLRSDLRPDLFDDEPESDPSQEQADVYICPSCGQSEIFLDGDQADIQE